jgi:hypothetical protein
MSRCGIIRAVQIAFVIVSLAGGGAARAEVALGASFGYTHLSYPDVPHYTNDIVGIPGTEEWGQPGIRIGYHAPGGRWDLNADIGLAHRSGTLGSDETTVELLPQVQANVVGRDGFSPFVNGGVGIMRESASTSATSSVTGTRAVFGAGIGVRKPVSDGHGLLRIELRYDHLAEDVKELSPSETFTFLAADLFSVKLGFDLLLGR